VCSIPLEEWCVLLNHKNQVVTNYDNNHFSQNYPQLIIAEALAGSSLAAAATTTLRMIRELQKSIINLDHGLDRP
jgi:allantoicase